MGKGQRQLELVRGDLSVAATLEWAGDGGWPGAKSSPSDSEGVHDGRSGGEDAMAGCGSLFMSLQVEF